MKFQLKKSFTIESARFLPNLPKDHPCSRTHGHSFHITFTFVGHLDSNFGWLIDYHELQKMISPVLKKIDHSLLNDVNGLENPTTENLTAWLYYEVRKLVPDLTQVTVSETSDTECSFPV